MNKLLITCFTNYLDYEKPYQKYISFDIKNGDARDWAFLKVTESSEAGEYEGFAVDKDTKIEDLNKVISVLHKFKAEIKELEYEKLVKKIKGD